MNLIENKRYYVNNYFSIYMRHCGSGGAPSILLQTANAKKCKQGWTALNLFTESQLLLAKV